MYQTSVQNRTSEFFKYIIAPTINILLYIFFISTILYGIYCGLYLFIQPFRSFIDETPLKNLLLSKFSNYVQLNDTTKAGVYILKILVIILIGATGGIVFINNR